MALCALRTKPKVRPEAGRHNALPLRDGRSLRCQRLAILARHGVALPQAARQGCAPQGLTGKQQMWKGFGWALDQPEALPHRAIIIPCGYSPITSPSFISRTS